MYIEDVYEVVYASGRQAKNLWKYIPEKLAEAVDETNVDSDGYWIYLKNGYVAYDGAEDCKVIHEYTVTDLKAAIKTIRKDGGRL